MQFSDEILSRGEVNALRLRELFHRNGYSRAVLGRFDEYALYASNREFLGGADIVTFTGSDGRLMALRPDVTLSVVSMSDTAADTRLYYHESVFRRAGLSRDFRERSQCGIERFGSIGINETADIMALAWRAMCVLGINGVIDISHVGIFSAISEDLQPCVREEVRALMSRRNGVEILKRSEALGILPQSAKLYALLAGLYGAIDDVRDSLSEFPINDSAKAVFSELSEIAALVKKAEPEAKIMLDLSLNQDVNYYSGLVFQGIAKGYASPILSGGRYDALLKRLGKPGSAIGFAVYVDKLEV